MGVVGLGFFGSLHAETICGLPEADLVAVCARRQASLDEFDKKGPHVAGWTDIERAAKESEAEAWVVAASTSAHIPITRLLLEAGKSVLLEKPIGQTLAEAETIRALVGASPGKLMMGHILLFGTEFRQLMDELPARGRPRYISAERHRPADLRDDPDCSPFNLVMIHDLYCIQVMMGGAEPTSFHSLASVPFGDGPADLALAQVMWGRETVASLTASFLAPPGMGVHGFDRMEVLGDGWMARLDTNPRPIQLWDDKSRYPLGIEIRADRNCPTGMLAEELRTFCRVVRGQQSVPVGATYDDAIQVQKWINELEQTSQVL